MKYFIILGGSLEQEKIFLLCKKYSLKIISVDIKKKPYCLKYSDIHLNISTKKPQDIYKEISKLKINKKIIGIISIASDIPVSVSFLSQKLNLKSISLKSAKLVSNKIKMKKKFLKFQIKTAKFSYFKNFKIFFKYLKSKSNDVVIKPSDNSGSRGVFLIDNKDFRNKRKVNFFFKESKKHSLEKKVIVEDFLYGHQLSSEGIFINKKFYNVAIADRNYSNIGKTKPYIIENGGSTPSIYHNKKFNKKVEKIIYEAAKSLGIDWGIIKADLVINNGIIKIIELAARISGGYFATHSIPAVYKIDLVEMLLREILGLKNKIPKLYIYNYVAQRYFFAPSGFIKKIKGGQNIKRNKNTIKYEMYLKNNSYQNKIKSHPDRSGMIMCSGKNYNEAISNVELMMSKIKFLK